MNILRATQVMSALNVEGESGIFRFSPFLLFKY